ncbi:MAG: MmcQ/YjbR family DNA-binding protein, partial [Nocardioidaceae bacterium]
DVAVMKVGGKMFALVPLSAESGSVNLKCDPALALELRQAYPGIEPGYHQNKRHWNTVSLDGSVEDDVVRGLIADSYDLVVAQLPRAIRADLARG